jgi:hypothetical protein
MHGSPMVWPTELGRVAAIGGDLRRAMTRARALATPRGLTGPCCPTPGAVEELRGAAVADDFAQIG